MNSRRVKSLLLSGALTVILFLCIFISSAIFVQGPYIKDRSADLRLHRQLMESMRAQEGERVGRYALNEVTYISRVTSLSKRWLVWYDDQLTIKAQIEEAQIDSAQALAIGEQNGIRKAQIQFGWVKDRPAVILEDAGRELALDAQTLEKLMLYEKR